MIVFRALNNEDMINYKNGNPIFCTLYNVKNNIHSGKVDKNFERYYNLTFYNNRKYALDLIEGHILGHRLKTNSSPWVSASSDFDFVAAEYAVPQAGKYNHYNNRKPILVLEIEDEKVLNNSDTIKDISSTREYDFGIDLRNDKVIEYHNKSAISSETDNKELPGIGKGNLDKFVHGEKTDVSGIAHYATKAKEIVFYWGIDPKYYKTLIYPFLQDIIYSCNIDINYIIENKNKIDKVLDRLQPLCKDLYPTSETGINLTDYLIDNYDFIYGNNIDEKYHYLRLYKVKKLQKVVDELNKELSIDLKITKLIDDKLIACTYNTYNKLSKNQKHDVLVLEKDGILYSYDSKEEKYYKVETGLSKTKVL